MCYFTFNKLLSSVSALSDKTYSNTVHPIFKTITASAANNRLYIDVPHVSVGNLPRQMCRENAHTTASRVLLASCLLLQAANLLFQTYLQLAHSSEQFRMSGGILQLNDMAACNQVNLGTLTQLPSRPSFDNRSLFQVIDGYPFGS